MSRYSPIFGTICIIFGLVFLFLGLAPYIKTILLILLGLFLVNYGLRLRSMPSAQHFARTWWFHIRRFR